MLNTLPIFFTTCNLDTVDFTVRVREPVFAIDAMSFFSATQNECAHIWAEKTARPSLLFFFFQRPTFLCVKNVELQSHHLRLFWMKKKIVQRDRTSLSIREELELRGYISINVHSKLSRCRRSLQRSNRTKNISLIHSFFPIFKITPIFGQLYETKLAILSFRDF